MERVIFVLLAARAEASLLRVVPPGVGGCPCIAVPLDRLIAPGMQRTLHLYDSSCLAAFRAGNGTLGQVVLDPSAGRRVRVLPLATELRVTAWRPSQKQSRVRDEVSSSVLVDVIGVGTFEPQSVLQYEPYLSVETPEGDGRGAAEPVAIEDSLRETACQLLDSAALCESLESGGDEQSDGGEGGAAVGAAGTAYGIEGCEGEGAGSLPLEQCVDRALELGGACKRCEVSRLRLRALALTRYLPGQQRYDAMRKGNGPLDELLAFVIGALDDHAKRQAAVNALNRAVSG